ncbi:DUF3465 domain-containing protein [Salinicola socius]|uniref:DUF3465 domain-containing protein n=1 Tax=Salinicola socius TaxID=404433 RepID=A0A1Q8SSL6_9GAMM|nr:DUF3465 domain-containing protein [Salinicola socius]OLO04435.1 hypothetical protein BTW07_09815 [Salinicola socius]
MSQRFIKTLRRPVVVTLLALVVVAPLITRLAGGWPEVGGGSPSTQRVSGFSQNPVTQAEAAERLERAFDTHEEGFWIEAAGRVVRVLPDDRQGSRHQRIIVALETGQTLLIAHNIDLAPRIEYVEPGDRLRFRGEYVWNAQGGVIHWTHHDPDGSGAGGWLEHRGRRYR